MLVLTRRINERLLFPGLHTTIQVVSIKPGLVRLGIDAPEEVRVLREEVPDRVAQWGPPPEEEQCPSVNLVQLNQMLNRRLEIVRKGLTEAQELAVRQPEDASRLLARVEEDLCLLQRRLRAEVEKIGPLVRPETEEEFRCVAASPVRPH
jgi:carbon storage regulator CsrA